MRRKAEKPEVSVILSERSKHRYVQVVFHGMPSLRTGRAVHCAIRVWTYPRGAALCRHAARADDQPLARRVKSFLAVLRPAHRRWRILLRIRRFLRPHLATAFASASCAHLSPPRSSVTPPSALTRAPV